MRVGGLAAIALVVCASALAAQQQVVIDGIVRVVNGDIVTMLDVRQAKLLKLVQADPWTDDAIADRLVERRLMLADAARGAVKDPAADLLAQRYKAWEATLGSGADIAALLARAGLTEAGVRAWLIDDLRIDAYADLMFRVGAEPTPSEMLAYYQSHVNDYADGGTVKAFVTVQREVRTALRAETQAKLRAQWLANLKRRATITVVKGG